MRTTVWFLPVYPRHGYRSERRRRPTREINDTDY